MSLATLKAKVEQLIDTAAAFNSLTSISLSGNTTTEHIILNCKNIKTLYRTFYNCKVKTFILSNTNKVTNWQQAFLLCPNAETIETLDLSGATDSLTGYWMANSVKNLKFVSETIKQSVSLSECADLTAESIQSIFDGLAVVTTAQTLTLHANLKILQSQVDSANAKGWTVAGGTVVSEEEYYG